MKNNKNNIIIMFIIINNLIEINFKNSAIIGHRYTGVINEMPKTFI